MRSPFFRTIVWVVAGAVIVLLSLTTGNAVAHEIQHAAHHNAGIHGSGICAWMCAAAGAHVVTPVHQAQLFDLVGHVPLRSDKTSLSQPLVQSRPRAPPISA
ncbi:MAG: hypothetical protein OJF47_002441 [Nitrospira sp.]|nr:MAG: hypothetical protein OJF47_002441 [Nitrospira sp.]